MQCRSKPKYLLDATNRTRNVLGKQKPESSLQKEISQYGSIRMIAKRPLIARKSNLLNLPEEARRKKEAESDHWWDRQHSLVLRQTPRWAQGLAIALIILGGGGIIASTIIKIDEVITVTGTLKPTDGIYEVKTPAGGLVEKVFTKRRRES